MHSHKLNAGSARQFSTSFSKEPCMVPWIRARSPKPDPPTEIPRKTKYISHESVIKLIKREKDPRRLLSIFNMVTNQRGFSHNHSTYAVTLHQLARLKQFEHVDLVLHQMTYETCKFHESIFLDLMTHFSKSSLHNLQEAKRVFNEIKGVGLHLDKVGYTTFINCLCRSGEIDEAIRVLKEMEEKDCKGDHITFNIILVGLCRYDRTYEALEMLERLPYEGVYLDKSSYRIVLNSLCKLGYLQKATELVGVMASRGFLPHFATSNELLVHLCEAGSVVDAAMVLAVLAQMGFNPEPRVWSRLLEVTCRERSLLSTFELNDVLIKGTTDGGNREGFRTMTSESSI